MAANWQSELKRTWSAACNGAVRAVLLSPRGKVAAATASSIVLFDGPPSFALRRELHGQAAGLTAAAFSCKGTELVSGGADGFLKWWQVDSGEELCSTQFPLGDGAAPAPGGQQLPADPSIPEVACSKGGYVAAASGRLLCIFGPGGEHLHTLDASGDGSLQHVTWLDEATVLGCCGAEATIWRVDAESYEEAGAYGTNPPAHIAQLAMSPNGRYLAAACGNSTIQIWDTQQEGSMDPFLVISEGIDGPVAALSWDASSRLLAAAIGSEALVWDVPGSKEGQAEASYVCIGFEQGTAITCLAFQPNGTLLAAAADNGLCLVFDSATFGAGSVASGLVTHVASGRLASADAGDGGGDGDAGAASVADTGAIAALAWHSTGSLLLGSSTGVVGALQPLRASMQRAQSDAAAAAAVEASGLRRQDSAGGKRRATPQPANGGAPAPQAAKPAGGAGGAPPQRGAPAGWGGEPLSTNGVAGGAAYADASQMGPGGRGRGGRGMGRGRFGPGGMQTPFAPPYAKSPDGRPPGPRPMGAMPDQAQMMQAVGPWGMMPAAMAPHMWRQMGMGYAMTPYGQMMAVPQMQMGGYPAGMPGAAPPMGGPPQGGRGGPYGRGVGGPMPGRGRGGPGGDAGGGRGAMGAPYGGRGRGFPPSAQGEQRGERQPRRDSGQAAAADSEGSPGPESAGDEPAAPAQEQADPQGDGQQQEAQPAVQQQSPPQAQAQQQEQAQQQQQQQQSRALSTSGPRSGPRSSNGDRWQSESGGGGGYRQQGGPAAAQLQAPQAGQPGGAGGMMVRPPYGMAPVYMTFPQAAGMAGGMMPTWGMMGGYPGQMAAYAAPMPGGYMMAYPAAYGAAAAQQAALQSQPSGGSVGADGDARRDGPRGGYGGGGGGGAGQLTTLYVGNLAPTVDEAALAAQFEAFGPVDSAQVIRDRETHEPKGYGFINFSPDAPQAASAAMARLNGTSLPGAFGGRTIRVSPSNKWRSGGVGGGGVGGGGGGGGGGEVVPQAAAGAR
ncbi:hypothetical protein Rsub_06176 [Raphidocelis subcapitata]|uniref:RRM domain-containing protein n=1 Tax=Raphidocelis subcapitata TaxID=307507 RepID=A0A2V0P9T3_9CHLO|nr:hypothetical protein Rsub_06176 [Raphidocelis subcapitata]|eukprot:GBF93927.1 hypothetical protein Rsub_06176 [Raphidocelis subcapitata]